ncbi:MAG: glycine cleavage system aminomethyltransferase GcvT, partial [Gammaproteobacteria bacterium]|nr:glycine cleavage system aminomethyltransferase GcvT [Gammaproteobacteria bacterium]
MKVTVLHPEHQKLGAKLVDFAGYEMPLHYGSQIEEHHAVRQKAGMFDVSHMQVIDINGLDAFSFLQKMVANDVGKLKPGKALYTCMLNDSGGIIDDLIVYQLPDFFRVIVNAGTKHTDLAWLKNHAEGLNLMLTPRDDLSILAVQGREARQSVASVLPTQAGEAVLALKPFHFIEQDHRMVARTGYTGEDGVELILPHDSCVKVWRDLLSKGVKPCGLGARDTLRLEAGLNLYGLDMDDQVTPFESNLTWTVALKDNRLKAIKNGPPVQYIVCNTFGQYPSEVTHKLLNSNSPITGKKYNLDDIFIIAPSVKSARSP